MEMDWLPYSKVYWRLIGILKAQEVGVDFQDPKRCSFTWKNIKITAANRIMWRCFVEGISYQERKWKKKKKTDIEFG